METLRLSSETIVIAFFKKNSKALMIRKIEEMDTERLKRTEATIFDGVTN